MAGGVWCLREWERLDRQSRDRPGRLPVRHPAAADQGKPDLRRLEARLLTLSEGDVYLNRFSPTGFYSSAVRNDFLNELQQRVRAPGRLSPSSRSASMSRRSMSARAAASSI